MHQERKSGKSAFIIRERLLQRIGADDIHEITYLTQGNNKRKSELYNLIFDADETVAWQAAWVLGHFSLKENEWLYDKHNELIDEVLSCRQTGRKRLLLHLLFRQPQANPPRTDFFDYCLAGMVSAEEPPGVRALCMKLAYEMSRPIPELLQEVRALLEIMEHDFHIRSICATRKNILLAMRKGKSLQVY